MWIFFSHFELILLFLSGNTGPGKEIEEIEQVETDQAKEQEKEQSVNACWGSNDYIHFGLFVVELLKLFDCRIETFLYKMVGPLMQKYLFRTYRRSKLRTKKVNLLLLRFDHCDDALRRIPWRSSRSDRES